MAAIKAPRLAPFRDYTHTLAINLHNPSSFVTQLETSLQPLRKDAFALKIPEKAIYPLEFVNLYLGKLKLDTPQRHGNFSKFLHGLDYPKLLGPAPESAQPSSVATKHLDTARSSSHVAPLRINFSGLATTAPDPSKAFDLLLLAVDPTGRLQPFTRSLIECFAEAGFPMLKPPPQLRWQIISSTVFNWEKPRTMVGIPKFDVRELLKVYENVIWAKDVPLDRLSLHTIGATKKNPDGKKVFGQQPEIDSVALP